MRVQDLSRHGKRHFTLGVIWPSRTFAPVSFCTYLPSVLWRCWLGGRKGIQPVKTEWWGAGMIICLERGADLHMFQLMPLPLTVYCFSKIQIDFTFLVPTHPGSPGQRAVKRVCVCVCLLKFILSSNIWTLFYSVKFGSELCICSICIIYRLSLNKHIVAYLILDV